MYLSLTALLEAINPQFTKEKCIAIDVGAHFGGYSQFLRETGMFAKVIAFEPNIENYRVLSAESDKYAKNTFEVVNAALSNKAGILELFCDEDSATGSLLNYAAKDKPNEKINSQVVNVFTLDGYLNKLGFADKLGLIKIDTQGNDLAVILGAEKTIALHRPIIQTEFIYIPLYEGQCTPKELEAELTSLNYTLYALNNLHVTKQGRLAFCDALYIPVELGIITTHEYTCIDNISSYREQIFILEKICAERLALINRLDADLNNHIKSTYG